MLFFLSLCLSPYCISFLSTFPRLFSLIDHCVTTLIPKNEKILAAKALSGGGLGLLKNLGKEGLREEKERKRKMDKKKRGGQGGAGGGK